MFDVHLPIDPILKRFIRFIYIFRNHLPEQEFSVLPYTGAALTIFENARFSKAQQQLYVAEPYSRTTISLHLMRPERVKIRVKGPVTAIMMMFTPLGVNQFITSPLSKLLGLHDRSVIPFDQCTTGFEELQADLADTDCAATRMLLIEAFLKQNYRGFSSDILSEVIKCLSDPDCTYTIQQICRKTGTSERTLNRLFMEHLCMTPVQFKGICQFRHSVQLKLGKNMLSLNQLAYESNYSDQAYLVRIYKKFTGLSPKQLFNDFNDVTDNYLFHIIQKKLAEKYKNNY